MSLQFADIAAQAAAAGVLTAEDLRALRGSAWMDGMIGPQEAAALFEINDQIANPDMDWVDFFVEALSCWLVEQQNPRGYVDEAQAQWLMDRIAADGRLGSRAELELLVRCFEKAVSTPQALKDFALAEVEKAVIFRTGSTRDGGELDADGVSASEAKLLRRLIFSPGSERPAAVCQAEAEMLFRIKDATMDQNNAPEWQQLFVQGVGNYLQGFGGAEPLSRQREADLERFLAAPNGGLGGFLRNMGRAGLGSGLGDLMRKREGGHDLDTAIFEARQVSPGENTWLHNQIDRNGRVDPLEEALLKFIAEK